MLFSNEIKGKPGKEETGEEVGVASVREMTPWEHSLIYHIGPLLNPKI